MILLSIWSFYGVAERPPVMTDGSAVLGGLPAVGGKPARLAFDDGVLPLAEVERRLGIAERRAP
jgi:hypothetical protein